MAVISQMKVKLFSLSYLSGIAGILAAAGDFVVTGILGALYPGYDFIHQSESYLGSDQSPVALYMNVWGIVFCFLLMFFAYGLRTTILNKGMWQFIAAWCVVLYGSGEGAGSGIFPHNHVNGVLTMTGQIHDLFGAVAGVGIVILPFAGTIIFSIKKYRRMHIYSWIVFITGPILIGMFLLSKQDIIPFKGLWQRLFILDYHVYLVALAIIMIGTIRMCQRRRSFIADAAA